MIAAAASLLARRGQPAQRSSLVSAASALLPTTSSSISTSAAPADPSTTTTPPTQQQLPDPAPGIVEMRQYALHPSGMNDYLRLTRKSASVRRRHLPLVGFFQNELGGDLSTLTHFYAYPQGLDQRTQCRKKALEDPEWTAYVKESRSYVREQKNAALFEWPSLYAASGAEWRSASEYAGSSSGGGINNSAGVYELRTYRIAPTASVRRLVHAFEQGLPAKVAAARRELGEEGGGGGGGGSGGGGSTSSCDLALFGSAQIGDLDTVVELWRYRSADECLRARVAARRGAPEWSKAVQSVAQGVSAFKVEMLVPLVEAGGGDGVLSPMR
jgi:hypothetical protein